MIVTLATAQIFLSRSTTCLYGQCKFAYKFGKLWDTIPECIQNASSADIFKTHILTVSHDVCTCTTLPMQFLRVCFQNAASAIEESRRNYQYLPVTRSGSATEAS